MVENIEATPGSPEPEFDELAPEPQPEPQPEAPPAGPNPEARTWAMAAHLSGLLSFIGPLVVWIVQKRKSPFVDGQGKEALNFQISIFIYGIAAFLIGSVLFFLIPFLTSILIPLVGIADIVLLTVAAVRAHGGTAYRYPLTIRFVR